MRNVSPSSPSSWRRLKTTLAASTCVARPLVVAREDQLLAVVQAAVGELEDVLATSSSG